MDILGVLSGKNFRIYNYIIAKNIGISETILLADLVTKYEYHENEGDLGEDGYFYSTVESVYKSTALRRHPQETAIKTLMALGLINKKLAGVPQKRYFTIYKSKITDFIQNLPDNPIKTHTSKTDELNGGLKSNKKAYVRNRPSRTSETDHLERPNETDLYNTNYNINTIANPENLPVSNFEDSPSGENNTSNSKSSLSLLKENSPTVPLIPIVSHPTDINNVNNIQQSPAAPPPPEPKLTNADLLALPESLQIVKIIDAFKLIQKKQFYKAFPDSTFDDKAFGSMYAKPPQRKNALELIKHFGNIVKALEFIGRYYQNLGAPFLPLADTPYNFNMKKVKIQEFFERQDNPIQPKSRPTTTNEFGEYEPF